MERNVVGFLGGSSPFESTDGFDILAQHIPNYERREGQIQLARAVKTAIERGEPLLAEGPTGTGKTITYLINAINLRKRTLIVTANISLQEQIFNKDIPFLSSILNPELKYMLLKGRNNYLCLKKAGEFFSGDKNEGESNFSDIRAWAYKTESGDKSELPIPCKFWYKISSSSDECLGNKCTSFLDCWTKKAREGLDKADIIVTNYHMMLINPPKYELLICDEAHELPGIARDVLGFTLRKLSTAKIVNYLRTSENSDGFLADVIDSEMRDFFDAAKALLGKKDRARIRGSGWFDSTTLIQSLRKAAMNIAQERFELEGKCNEYADSSIAKVLASDMKSLDILRTSAINLEKRVHMLSGQDPYANHVYWVEKDNKNNIVFEGRPLDVSNILKDLYEMETSVFMSATMSFPMFMRETGAPPNTPTIVIDSPFDHKRLASMIIPKDVLPPPKGRNDPANWHKSLALHFAQLIRYCDGRSMGLFTSNKALKAVAEILRGQGLNIVCQGERSSNKEIIEALKKGECQAILGVSSFWTGVDIPGPALSGLFLNRLPFGVPDDPLNEALDEAITRAGGNSFRERVIPTTIMKVRQGVGRLIRTTTDTGIVMIADKRIMTAGWCKPILQSLPPYQIFGSIQQLQDYLRGAP